MNRNRIAALLLVVASNFCGVLVGFASEPTEAFFNAKIHAYIPQGIAAPEIHNFEITPREFADAFSKAFDGEGEWTPFKNDGFVYLFTITDDFAGTSKTHRFLFTASADAPGGIVLSRAMTDGEEESAEAIYQTIKLIAAAIIESR